VPGLGRFLLGRFFYSDAVNTIIVVMSVVAVRAMGLTEQQYAGIGRACC
jgi:MFS-type transporter involved in bile tolerance (Atg22 family)